MNKELIFNPDLHFEHETWMRELDFWNDEIESFQNRLNELVMRFSDKEMFASIEKFQNQIVIHEAALKSIRSQIQMHESNMADHYRRDEDSLNAELVKKHLSIRENMEDQRSIMSEMKKTLFAFLTQYI